MLQLIFIFFWPGGAVELSTAQSLKCKLIFYVIFQYIFYSLNLFQNFCCLFYKKRKTMWFILRPLPPVTPRGLNERHHLPSMVGGIALIPNIWLTSSCPALRDLPKHTCVSATSMNLFCSVCLFINLVLGLKHRIQILVSWSLLVPST